MCVCVKLSEKVSQKFLQCPKEIFLKHIYYAIVLLLALYNIIKCLKDLVHKTVILKTNRFILIQNCYK